MGRASRPSVVGFVGDSGIGKTTLLECLIPVLSARGLAVGAVKHASHGFDADRPGKDSYRLYESGAEAVALVSASQLATFVRRQPDEGASLEAGLTSLPPGLDVVLVEGFAWEPIPRFVLVREGETPAGRYTAAGAVLRVLSLPETPPRTRPAFAEVLLRSIAAEIAGSARLALVTGPAPAPPAPRPSPREAVRGSRG